MPDFSLGSLSLTILYCCKLILSFFFFGHREAGIVIKNVDISSGEITLNLNEELLLKSKSSSKSSSNSDSVIGSQADSASNKKPSKKQQRLAAFSKYSSMFPEKVVN